MLKLNVGKKILIVSNPIVFANYGQITLASLKREKFKGHQKFKESKWY